MKQSMWQTMGAMVTVVALAGCAASGSQGGTSATVQVQQDPSSRVTHIGFAPQPSACGRISHCPTIGAQWSSEHPNRATLLVGTWGAERKVQAATFNARPYAPLRVRSLAKEGTDLPGVTAFVVPMDTLERVAFGKDAWVRLTTDQGEVEELMHNGERSSPASDALKRLVFEAYKGTDKEMSGGLFSGDQAYQPNYDK